VSLARGPPLYKFCFREGEGYAQTHISGLDSLEQSLQRVDVSSVGKRDDGQAEVVQVGEHQPTWDSEVKGCQVDKEQEGGDGGALRGPKVDRGWAAAAVAQEGSDPEDLIGGDPALP